MPKSTGFRVSVRRTITTCPPSYRSSTVPKNFDSSICRSKGMRACDVIKNAPYKRQIAQTVTCGLRVCNSTVGLVRLNCSLRWAVVGAGGTANDGWSSTQVGGTTERQIYLLPCLYTGPKLGLCQGVSYSPQVGTSMFLSNYYAIPGY
jgi:hypothetical protein